MGQSVFKWTIIYDNLGKEPNKIVTFTGTWDDLLNYVDNEEPVAIVRSDSHWTG